jgi:hypothetical protein
MVSIFRVKKRGPRNQPPRRKQQYLTVEAISSYEKLVTFYQTLRGRPIPEYSIFKTELFYCKHITTKLFVLILSTSLCSWPHFAACLSEPFTSLVPCGLWLYRSSPIYIQSFAKNPHKRSWKWSLHLAGSRCPAALIQPPLQPKTTHISAFAQLQE